jgi:hypothetical protein
MDYEQLNVREFKMNRLGEDIDFRNRLSETLLRSELPRELNEALNIENHRTAIIKSARAHRFVFGCCRALLSWMCRFRKFGSVTSDDKRGGWRIKRRPHVILVIYVLCLSMIAVNVYHQYIYDASILRLGRVRAILQSQDTRQQLLNQSGMTADAVEKYFERRASEARQALKSLGATHLEWSFVISNVMIVASILGMMFYFTTPYDYSSDDTVMISARALLDNEHDARVQTRIIVQELDRLIASSLSFMRAKFEQAIMDSSVIITAATPKRLQHERSLAILRLNLTREHGKIVEQLKTNALEGRLNPLNRSPACRDRLALLYLISVFGLLLGTVVPPIVFHHLIKSFFDAKGKRLEITGIKDLTNFLCMLYVYFVYVVTVVSLSSLHVITICDKLVAIERLKLLILYIIRKNKTRSLALKQLLNSQNGSSVPLTGSYSSKLGPVIKSPVFYVIPPFKLSLLISEIESDLQIVLLQCRLFDRHFRTTKRLESMVALILACSSITAPILIRLQNNYIYAELKPTGLLLTFMIISFCFVFLVPLALLHQHCLKAFNALWSLVAQLSHLELENKATINKYDFTINSNIAALTIRRELADFDRKMERFACQILGAPVTYGNLIRAAFWLFFLLISIADQSGRLAAIMADPFGVYELEFGQELGAPKLPVRFIGTDQDNIS